jgi:hypothetical protein
MKSELRDRLPTHSEGPNLLDKVIANDHLALGGLVTEISRNPPTERVLDELVAGLARRLRVHLAVGEHLLFPLLIPSERAVVEQAGADHARLRASLAALRTSPDRDVAALHDALVSHVTFEETVVLPLAATRPDANLQGLGFAFSQWSDAGLNVPPPDANPATGVRREG